ncbi:MAG: hypothetical protein ACX94B_17360 [Henriciella sp.]
MNRRWPTFRKAKRDPKTRRFFGAVPILNLRPCCINQRAENRPATVTGRLRHPPDKKTEPSGGVWLIEDLRIGRGSFIAPFKKDGNLRP